MKVSSVVPIHLRVIGAVIAIAAFAGILALAEHAQRRVDEATQELAAPYR